VDLDAGPAAVDQLRRAEEVQRRCGVDTEAPQLRGRGVAGDQVGPDDQCGRPDLQGHRVGKLAVDEHTPPWAAAPPPRAHEAAQFRVSAVVERLARGERATLLSDGPVEGEIHASQRRIRRGADAAA
jgi:hypothetical protein